MAETTPQVTEYKNEQVRFTVPTRPTVRQQLEYLGSAAITPGPDMFLRLWAGVVALVQEWECELIPDPKALDLDEEDNPDVSSVVVWAGARVREHMNQLDSVPKN